MPIPVLPAASGWRWFVRSLALIASCPLRSTLATFCFLIACITLNFFPLATLLWPLFIVGLMCVYHNQAQGQGIFADTFLKPLRKSPAPLVLLGAINMTAGLCVLAITILPILLAGGWKLLVTLVLILVFIVLLILTAIDSEGFSLILHIPDYLAKIPIPTSFPTTMPPAILKILDNHSLPGTHILVLSVSALLFFVLMCCLNMVNWFAPLLIAWQRLPIGQAIVRCLATSLRNWRAFLINGLVMTVFGMASVIIFLVLITLILPRLSPPFAHIFAVLSSLGFLLFVITAGFVNSYHCYCELFAKDLPESRPEKI
jgi:hypothetical protein